MALRVFVAHGGHPSLVLNAEEGYGHANTSVPRYQQQRLASESSPAHHQQQQVFSSTPSRHTPNPAGDTQTHGTATPLGHHSLADISHISFSSHGQPTIDGLRLKPSNRSRAIFTQFSRVVYPIWRKRICHFKDNIVSFLILSSI